LVVAAAAVWAVGSQRHLPAPFGVADNGSLAFVSGGDLWARDTLTGQSRLLAGGDGDQNAPSYSPDGQWITYVTTLPDGDHFMLARTDGSRPRELALIPRTANAQAAWRPDSAAIGFIYDDPTHVPRLSIGFVDGSPARVLDVGHLVPTALTWRPPAGGELLVRVMKDDGTIDQLLLRPATGEQHLLGLPSDLALGATWDNTGAVFSNDGSVIAYNRVLVNPSGAAVAGRFRVYLVHADGSADSPVPAPDGSAFNEAWPLFSPDGRSILVHRWTWKGTPKPEGWLAVMPADGSASAHDVGPHIPGGQDTGLGKIWSPDGAQVLMSTDNTKQVFSIDPISGAADQLDWTQALPDWQRTAH
jgi:Tol biopolymer transport system component